LDEEAISEEAKPLAEIGLYPEEIRELAAQDEKEIVLSAFRASGLKALPNLGGGWCLYVSIGQLLNKSPKVIHQRASLELEKHPERYKADATALYRWKNPDQDWKQFVIDKGDPTSGISGFGDFIMANALCNSLGIRIRVFTADPKTMIVSDYRIGLEKGKLLQRGGIWNWGGHFEAVVFDNQNVEQLQGADTEESLEEQTRPEPDFGAAANQGTPPPEVKVPATVGFWYFKMTVDSLTPSCRRCKRCEKRCRWFERRWRRFERR
jgi:hypothetical protein